MSLLSAKFVNITDGTYKQAFALGDPNLFAQKNLFKFISIKKL